MLVDFLKALWLSTFQLLAIRYSQWQVKLHYETRLTELAQARKHLLTTGQLSPQFHTLDEADY